MFTHYGQFTAQGYEPCADADGVGGVDTDECEAGLGMKISGYDGASAPSVLLAAWRNKLAGKVEHLRPEELPVFVTQAYQDLNLIRTDSNFMVGCSFPPL
jgi:hypothetical protein